MIRTNRFGKDEISELLVGFAYPGIAAPSLLRPIQLCLSAVIRRAYQGGLAFPADRCPLDCWELEK